MDKGGIYWDKVRTELDIPMVEMIVTSLRGREGSTSYSDERVSYAQPR